MTFKLIFLLFFKFSLFLLIYSSPLSYYNVGIMFSLEKDGKVSPRLPFLHSILRGFNDINNKNDGIYDDILPNTQLRIIHRAANDQYLHAVVKAGEILATDPKRGIIANIGPSNVTSIPGAAPAYQEAGGVPIFNYRDRTAPFGRSDLYPNMIRPNAANYDDSRAIASLISQYFGWEKVTMFYQSTDYSRISAQIFRHYADKYGINVLSSHILDTSSNDYSSAIEDAIQVGARIFVLFLDPTVGVKLITQGQQLKLFNNGKTQIIGGEELSLPSSWALLNISKSTLNTLLTGYIGVSYRPYAPPSEMKTKFLNDWVNQKSTKGYVDSNGVSHCDLKMDYYNTSYLYQYQLGLDKTKPFVCAGINYTSYKTHKNFESELDPMMYGYDAVLSVALGLHYLIYNLNNMNPTPNDLHSVLISKNFSFIGLTGKVQYSTEMIKDQLDVGGRLTDLNYNILNYVPYEIDSTNSSYFKLNINNKVVFKTIINWNSETGFPECNNQTHYIYDKKSTPCVSFQFQTTDNSFPLDSPPPDLEYLSISYQLILFIFAALGVIGVLFTSLVLHLYKSRKLIKMNQPILSYMMLLGMLFGFIRVVIVTSNATSNICRTRLWLEHLAFQLIFGTLVVRSLRVYLVTCTMKRTKVTEKQCVILVLLSMIITIGFLIALIATDDKNSAVVDVIKNQFEYTQNLVCDYDSRNILDALYIYELFILLTGLVFCWLIRNVKSTISNTTTLLEGIITTTIVIILFYILLNIIKLTPYTRIVIVGMVISLTLFRLLWVFYSSLIYNLFAGYELDRALTLRKTEKNILQLMRCSKLSNKILATNDDDNIQYGRSIKVGKKVNRETVISSSNVNLNSNRTIDKYKNLKNQDEFSREIDRVKTKMQEYQVEIGYLENLIFTLDQDDSNSKSLSQSKHSHNESMLQSNHNNRQLVENGVFNQQPNNDRNDNHDNQVSQYQVTDGENKVQMTSFSRNSTDYPINTITSLRNQFL